MPQGSKILGKPIDEEKWSKAKARAAEQGHVGDYAYIMDIYKKMNHLGEFEEPHIAERQKKGEKLPAWRRRRWDSKHHSLKTKGKALKSIDDGDISAYHNHVRLIIGRGDSLDEFRCGECGALLLKGMHLEKALLEVRCRRCGSLVINQN